MSRTLLSAVAYLLASTDALRLETVMNRRAIARAIAAVPLAGLAQTAIADGRVSTAVLDGEKKAPWQGVAASNDVLGYVNDGKGVVGFDATLDAGKSFDGAKGFQQGKRVNEAGAAFKKESLTGSPTQAASLSSRKGGNPPSIRIAGKWADPGHPGCERKIQLAGNKAFITGADEDGKPWKVIGIVEGSDVMIDFSPKGGPKDVKATFVIGKGLTFPDGNVWTKKA